VQYQPMPKQPESIQVKWATALRQAEPSASQLTFQLLPPAYGGPIPGTPGGMGSVTHSVGGRMMRLVLRLLAIALLSAVLTIGPWLLIMGMLAVTR
jgi:hypothetical protein